jgi:hypothetical protein
MSRKKIGPVILDWDDRKLDHYLNDPTGEIGVELVDKLGAVVLAGAKRRALRRTGAMASAMRYRVIREDGELYAVIESPVQNKETGFPYAVVHEGKKVRDRRPHRSLRPALRDIRKILPRAE